MGQIITNANRSAQVARLTSTRLEKQLGACQAIRSLGSQHAKLEIQRGATAAHAVQIGYEYGQRLQQRRLLRTYK